jgi:hypothetical protein
MMSCMISHRGAGVRAFLRFARPDTGGRAARAAAGPPTGAGGGGLGDRARLPVSRYTALRVGARPDTHLAPGTLDSLTRRYLRESFRAIVHVQNRLESVWTNRAGEPPGAENDQFGPLPAG